MPTAAAAAPAPTPINRNAVAAGTTGKTASATPRMLSDEAQHVIDALEAHWNALVQYGQASHPNVTRTLAKFGDDVLAKLDAWGLQFRGELQTLETSQGNQYATDAEKFVTAGSLPGSTLVAPLQDTTAVSGTGTLSAGQPVSAGQTTTAESLPPGTVVQGVSPVSASPGSPSVSSPAGATQTASVPPATAPLP